MSKKFKWFLVSIQFGLDSGDEESLLYYLSESSLLEDFGSNPDEFYDFFSRFDDLLDYRSQIKFLEREVSRLS